MTFTTVVFGLACWFGGMLFMQIVDRFWGKLGKQIDTLIGTINPPSE